MSSVKYVLDDSSCKICAGLKPQILRSNQNVLIKATNPMERLSLDFKGPVQSINSSNYLLVIVDKYSRFPFVFPCKNTSSFTVIQCLKKLFALTGTPRFIQIMPAHFHLVNLNNIN